MRKHAILLLTRHLFPITGLSVNDLPDTPEINKVIDELEGMLMDDAPKEKINEYLKETITSENIYEFI